MRNPVQAIAIFALMLFTSVAQAASAHESVPDWVVKVSSVYRHEDTGRFVRIAGTGTLVRIGKEYFVLTDAHVSQGPHGLKVIHPVLGELETVPAHRLADNQADLELIRLQVAPRVSVFQWDSSSRQFRIDEIAIQHSDRNFVQVEGKGWVPKVPWTKETPNGWQPVRKAIPQSWESISEQTKKDATRIWGAKISASDSGKTYVSDSGVVAGMSGGPIIQGSTIVGLTRGYHRYFKRSYFSSNRQIDNLVKTYEGGHRGKIGTAVFRYNGFTYRELEPGTKEVLRNQIPSGSVEIAAGGGTSVDGGGGTSVDGGGGTSVDGGAGSRSGRFQSAADLGISAGMSVRGKQALAYQIHSKQAKDDTLIYADAEGFDFTRQLKNEKVTTVESEKSIGRWIAKKAATGAKQPEGGKRLGPGADLGACHLEIQGGKTPERIKIRLPYKPKDRTTGPFTIELDGRGRLLGATSSRFEPIVQLRSKGGKKVRVDLRGLFSVVISSLQDSDSIQKYKNTPYIEMQTDGYLPDKFFCYPDFPGVFLHSETLAQDQPSAAQQAAACVQAIVEPVPASQLPFLDVLKKMDESVE